MPNLLDVEEKDSELPLLAIFSLDTFFLSLALNEFASKFRIIVLAEKKPQVLEHFPGIYFLDSKNGNMLPNLQEKLDYALLLFEDDNSPILTTPLLTKIVADKTKSLIIASVFSLQNSLPILQEFKHNTFITIALIGEVLTHKKTSQNQQLSKFIDNAILNREIRLTGNESFPVYGITKEDTITGISRLLFGNFQNDYYYLLFYQNPQTIIETAHIICRVLPETNIIFSDKAAVSHVVTRNEIEERLKSTLHMTGKYLDGSFEGFEKGVQALAENDNVDEDETGKRRKNISKKKIANRFVGFINFGLMSLSFGTFLFLFLNLLVLGICLLFLKNTLDDVKRYDFSKVTVDSKISETLLDYIKPSASVTFDLLRPFDKQGVIEGKYLVLQRLVGITGIVGKTEASLNGKAISKAALTTTLSNLSYLFQEGQRLVLETDTPILKDKLDPTYSKLLSFSGVLPSILGYDKPKEYLLLFQNDDELRPTGGFIGSVGDLTLKEGKVEELSIHDVYDLDGQLRNHVEPPFIVRRYLQPHLYLRDSNFYLNYQETASKAAFLYNLESGKEPGAVIALDLHVLKEILKVSGPIELPNYGTSVSSDNVSDFLESTIKDGFFPGSTQKKDVLNSVLTQLTLRLSSNPNFYFSLIKLLPGLLEQKDILVSFSDSSIQKVFSANNYAGEYEPQSISDGKTINDYLYINEANIGANKANAKVTRNVSYEVMLEPDRVVSKAILQLKNTSSSDNYKVYVKVAVPAKSQLTQILIDGTKQNIIPAVTDFSIYESKKFKTPDGLETEIYTLGDLSYFAFVTTAKKETTTTVEVDYNNGAGKPLSTVADYTFTYTKQPGTNPYLLTTTVDYPEGYLPVNTKADSYGENFLESATTVTKDFQTHIELQKSSVQK